ncbi:MAG TPA: hypothetical protein VJR89_27250 [Polyangiales bacterium]|nr:hypothetical protein [Polyangiales bacterium]
MAKLVRSVRLSIPHVDRVRAPCTIQRPDPRGDRPRFELLTTIAVVASGAGVMLALVLARVLPGPHAHSVSMQDALGQLRPAEPEAPATDVNAARLTPPAPEPVRVDRPLREAPHEPPVVAVAAKPEPQPIAPAPAKRRREKRAFVQGTVAYVRCGGADGHPRTECLRERKFEEHVWATLAKLPACDADPGVGSVELRWYLHKPDASGIEWRTASDAALNPRALAKCAGEKLGATRTRLRAQHAVMSFRFSLK